ncbi:hypothetical protein JAB2_44440 [Janthinobacterium sp. HH100]|nr:hypothetical protein JAB2_44440 [Janthinobacterium sp. HH100]
MARADGADGVKTAHARHLQIHQRDIGLQRLKLLHRLLAIGGLTHQRHAGKGAQQGRDAVEQQLVVVGDEDAYRCRIAAHDVAWQRGVIDQESSEDGKQKVFYRSARQPAEGDCSGGAYI